MELDPQGDESVTVGDHWQSLAEKVWASKTSKIRKVRADILEKQLWDRLENQQFDYASLLSLESLQLVERHVDEAQDGVPTGYEEDSVNHHVILIAILISVKARQRLPIWDLFADDVPRFSSFFQRVLSMIVDTSHSSKIRTYLLRFLVTAFQSLDNDFVRRECAPVVSIAIWHNLESDAARERKFEEHPHSRKIWRASNKRFDAASDDEQARLRFQRNWLFSLVVDFIARINAGDRNDVEYCERFLEFLIDLVSQLPTRRYVNSLLNDLNLLALIKSSTLIQGSDGYLLRDLHVLLRHYIQFSINDHTGGQYSQEDFRNLHCKEVARLQRLALNTYKDKLMLLTLSNYSSIEQRDELVGHLQALNDQELIALCSQLGFRTTYPAISGIQPTRELCLDIIASAYEKRQSFKDVIMHMAVLPTEVSLYEESLLRNEKYDGLKPLAIPRLNLQYMSVGDFLWRTFVLYRCEAFFEIRTFLEDVARRLQPDRDPSSKETKLNGFSKMALPIDKVAILETAPPRVGHSLPDYVRAEVTLHVHRLAEHVRRDWDSLHVGDAIFLVSVEAAEDHHHLMNGHTQESRRRDSGIAIVRVAEVVHVLDENDRVIRDAAVVQVNGAGPRPRVRRLIVSLDREAFQRDMLQKERSGKDIYESINVVVRRHKRENNFKKVLETVQNLALADTAIPEWFRDVFLGFGDPSSASYSRLASRLPKIDFQDTFMDFEHLKQSFPGAIVQTVPDGEPCHRPPFVIQEAIVSEQPAGRVRKRRREDDGQDSNIPIQAKTLRVSSYSKPSPGPFPSDAPKLNLVRFTPAQVEAIHSGTQRGLTLIVGPPGTGKTDVATQIISNIYHGFSSQRTLLIAHSNQALNQLFQKITNLDIDRRHLLRLGQGEGELQTEESYSKSGRVESFLENRAGHLAEVDRMATNLGAPGAHGGSCETAGYFNTVYVQPAWKRFWDVADSASSVEELSAAFPFHYYFQSAPQPLFPPSAPRKVVLDTAKACERHISRIFTELADIRPFEILRSNKDRMNYLMISEARIIAMTSTHAAMRQQEIANLGFHYDNVVMEEAAQITEVENFIPLVLQKPKLAEVSLQRIVLCGDHLQNSPVIQNIAFQHFANLDQSLFLRLIRLGVPAINLDAQGRARASIAELYKWRYPYLRNLPSVLAEQEFLRANAGFRYEYQFIDVPDYKGRGEHHPSPHFIQNLGEAEFAVALYQYMRLLGYPASKISIITTYAGQRALIRDVLMHRCANNRLFCMPRIVTTVDQYQGEQNDYIILSLVRTTRPGYLRDLRRLTVALSRARLGLYILGRRSVFESSLELMKAFDLLLKRPANLSLTVGEMYPSNRQLHDEVEATEMTGVEHLGQYVHEMTHAKVRMLKEGTSILPPQEPERLLDIDGDDDVQDGVQEATIAEEDPDLPEETRMVP